MGILRITAQEQPPDWKLKTRGEIYQLLGGKRYCDEPGFEEGFLITVDDVRRPEIESVRTALKNLGLRITEEEFLDTL